MSLAGSLEEYLNDPNFEQNRIEYKTNKEIADRNAKSGIKPSAKISEQGWQWYDAFILLTANPSLNSARV